MRGFMQPSGWGDCYCMLETHWNNKIATSLLCIAISGFMIVEILLNLTPPISRDALIHHLAIPGLWLAHGGFYEIPWADFSYYPMNIDLLYLIPLYFNNDIVPKFIHFAFGCGTGLLIYCYLKNRLSKNWGLLGFLVFCTTPAVARLSTTAYIDLGMVFFATASILAFVRWRDGNYKHTKWLALSAVCMGLAAGSKYNALIAWLFLNLVMVFYYSRDTGKGLPALGYGVTFFALALVVVSPWFIKNYIQTGNPIYPLFDQFFRFLHHAGEKSASIAQIGESRWTSNIFQRRGVVFGESFLETLFIPIRMFFQGKDASNQYFDGVLNPILIIMVPFAFLTKNLNRDKVFFLLFSVFFLFMAYFLTVIRIRYILTVVPFLAILSVIGIKNIVEWTSKKPSQVRRAGLIGIFAVTIIFIAFNFLYLKNYFKEIGPVKYILNQETKDEFLSRHIGSYPAMQYINENLPDNVRIFLMFLGRRGYYIDRPYYHEISFGMNTINNMVKASADKQDFRAYLQSLDCTHILMRTNLVNKYLHDNFPEKTIIRFLDIMKEYWTPVYESKGYAVWERA
ncbi:MAG: phospholipid carrier-dependent glycosyltransferase [Deltaproteobacteria bacterium]|nr:phospholipid carrier-dependent glycosyltransferase [Deltaproteobacteria bacterium]